jgi:hypothetical protein
VKQLFYFLSFFLVYSPGLAQPVSNWAEYNVIFGDNYDAEPHKIFYHQYPNSIWLYASKELQMLASQFKGYEIENSGRDLP